MNIEAEKMIGRFLWRRLVPGLVIIALVIIGVIYLAR